MTFFEHKENDNNDNLRKIHAGLYIASPLINVKFDMDFTKIVIVVIYFCLIMATVPKIYKKVFVNCNTSFLWKTPVNHRGNVLPARNELAFLLTLELGNKTLYN